MFETTSVQDADDWIIRGWLDAGKRSGKVFQKLGLPVPNK